MSVLIVDSSVAAKWFFIEQHSESALCLLHSRHELHAPDFYLLELDSVLARRIRAGELAANAALAIRAAIRRMPVQAHPFTVLLDPAFELAVATKQTVYDCMFLALAILLDAQMVTADRRFLSAVTDRRLAAHLVWVGNLAQD